MKMVLPGRFEQLTPEETVSFNGGYRASRSVYIKLQTVRISVASYVGAKTYATFLSKVGIAMIIGSPIYATFTTFQSIVSLYVGSASTLSQAVKYDIADGKKDGYITRYIPGHYATEINPYPPNSYEGAMF